MNFAHFQRVTVNGIKGPSAQSCDYYHTYSGLGVQVPHFYRQSSSNELLCELGTLCSGCPNAAPQDPKGKGRQDSLEHRTPSTNHLCSSMICEADMSWFYFLIVDQVT